MNVVSEPLPGVYVIETPKYRDKRGYLQVPFHIEDVGRVIKGQFTVDQTMYSQSKRNVLRGLHFQDATQPVAKLISCLSGIIYDVIIDLRAKSPTFGHWIYLILQPHGDWTTQVYAPVGTAHGFLALSETADVFYYQHGLYSEKASCILAWDDPDLNIQWPGNERNFILSDRDWTQGMSWAEYVASPMF